MTQAPRIINSESAPAPIGPYSQAVEAGGVLYCSGQIALNPETGEMARGTIEEETDQVLKNLGAVLKAAGLRFTDVVKTTIYLQSMSDFPQVNGVYEQYFREGKPARATVAVAGLPKGAAVEIDCVAYRSTGQ